MSATLDTAPHPTDPTPPPREQRSRRRRILFLIGLLPLGLALLLVLKVATMLYLNSTGRDDYAGNRLAAAAGAFETTLLGNVLESWVAPYDLGTTHYRQGDFDQARERLEEALALAPPPEQCRVRINLALADEALGDAALADGEVATARSRWRLARDVLAAGGCTQAGQATGTEGGTEAGTEAGTDPTELPGSDGADLDPDAEAGTRPSGTRSGDSTGMDRLRTAIAVDGRLRTKLAQAEHPDPDATPAPKGAAQSVAERNQRAEELRRRQEQRRQDKQDQETPPPPTSPPTAEPSDPSTQSPPPPPHYEW